MQLAELTEFLDTYLAVDKYDDMALNGLQVEASHEIKKVALAVDACSETFQKAAALRVDLLLTHHGLYWGKPFALTGMHAKRFKFLFQHDLSLYAVHLPLDLHPEVGNNVEIVKLLGLELGEEFGTYHGVTIGYIGRTAAPVGYKNFVDQVSAKLDCTPIHHQFGANKVKTVGVISGGGSSMLEQVNKTNIDTFLTGESDHVSYHMAKELGVNIIFAGHYATETLGVKRVGKLLTEKFGLETVFIDIPTGL